MDLKLFDQIMTSFPIVGFGQQPDEWRTFLEYVSSYFQARGIDRPIVVEIGIWTGHQRAFYEQLMGAEYIGIDMAGTPDIKGNSQDKAVLAALQKRLNGRKINLLFIDGCHTYEGVKSDYLMYGPLTEHIVVLHDVNSTIELRDKEPIDVMRFWKELLVQNQDDLLMTIQKHNIKQFYGRQMGIGVIVKK
jgi:hypothetical protein